MSLESHLLIIFHKVNHIGNLILIMLLLHLFWTRQVVALFPQSDFIVILFYILFDFLLLSLEVHSDNRISLSLTRSSLDVLHGHISFFIAKASDSFRSWTLSSYILIWSRHLQV